jgi:choloylglycine hydrolase
MEASDQPLDLRAVGNAMAGAVQVPRVIEDERVGGTLYTTFMNISDMEFMLVYQLDNAKITHLDLREEFVGKKRRRIKLI